MVCFVTYKELKLEYWKLKASIGHSIVECYSYIRSLNLVMS